MLEEYQFGEKIDITLISATVYSHDDKHLMVEVGNGSLVSIPTKGTSWAIRRRVPVDGVPLVDDLWADKNGERYFATSSGGQVKFIDGDNRFWDWEWINIERGPLRLVFRQCSTDPADAAADVPEELSPASTLTRVHETRDGVEAWLVHDARHCVRLEVVASSRAYLGVHVCSPTDSTDGHCPVYGGCEGDAYVTSVARALYDKAAASGFDEAVICPLLEELHAAEVAR